MEFFGRPRSRAWLVPPLVHPLRSINEIEKTPKFRKIQGRQLIELRKSYEFALKEAYNSLSKTADQRLASCHFKYVEGEFISDGYWSIISPFSSVVGITLVINQGPEGYSLGPSS